VQPRCSVKVGDDAEWTYIGTDNNAPYRIFYDASSLQDGIQLTLKAIVNDLSGNLNSTTINAVVGERPADVPDNVTIAGNFQNELGCPGNWQPKCAATNLTYDADDDVWQATFRILAGNWEYKAALNGSWDENYGANATRDGPNISLSLTEDTTVKFYYDHKTHWVTDNVNSIIATVPGNFQSEVGCPGDWQPDCLHS
jgi:hypothetical protein